MRLHIIFLFFFFFTPRPFEIQLRAEATTDQMSTNILILNGTIENRRRGKRNEIMKSWTVTTHSFKSSLVGSWIILPEEAIRPATICKIIIFSGSKSSETPQKHRPLCLIIFTQTVAVWLLDRNVLSSNLWTKTRIIETELHSIKKAKKKKKWQRK